MAAFLTLQVQAVSPSSPVAHYQQVGRARRQLDHAHGVLPAAADNDEQLWASFATASIDALPLVAHLQP